MSVDATADHFAPCPRGLETVLADELRALGAESVRLVASGVAFTATRRVALASNLHSRVASRILRKVASARYRGDDDLYRLAYRTPWEQWFDARKTLRIDVSAIRSPLRSLNFVTLRLKDGIVDRFRGLDGDRPSIDTRNPQVRLQAFLEERDASLYLDLSGESLFKRGWRADEDDKGEAPLKENLAAGIIALTGWRATEPLVDPFCGSGTLLIEAAQRALNIAPGLSRRFGFELLADHDEALWQELRREALQRQSASRADAAALEIFGSDIDGKAVEQTRRNAQRAGLPTELLRVRRLDVLRAHAPTERAGVVVCNPPYGERLSLDVRGDDPWAAVGQTLRQGFPGWKVWMLTSDLPLPRRLGIKERRRTPLYNGALECRLFGFDIYAARTAAAGPVPPLPTP